MSLLYARNVRYRVYDRLRHSTKFKKWLAIEATRLSADADDVFSWLVDYGLTAKQVTQLLKPPEAPDIVVGDLKYLVNGPTELVGDLYEGDLVHVEFDEGTTEFGSPAATMDVTWVFTDSDSDEASYTGASVIIPEGYGGGTLVATVTLTNVVGTDSAAMAEVDVLAGAEVAKTDEPSYTGDVKVGTEITPDAGSYTGARTPEVLIIWSVDGEDVHTGASYTPDAEDEGKELSITVFASNQLNVIETTLSLGNVDPEEVGDGEPE